MDIHTPAESGCCRIPLARLIMLFATLSSTLLTTSSAHAVDEPETLHLPRVVAVAMAIRRNIDLRSEALSYSMAETDAARSWGLYNPILSASAMGGISSYPGETFGSRNTSATIGLTQYLPTGGSLAASTQTGFSAADSTIPGTLTRDWQSSVGITVYQPLLKNFGKETMQLGITLSANNLKDSAERFRSYVTDTVLTVTSTYNHLYAVRQILESRIAALKSAETFRDELKKRAKPTAHQQLEIANAEYAISQRRRDLVDAERSVKDQEATLRYLIGIEEKKPIIPIDPPSRTEPQESEEQAVQNALQFRPDLKQYRLALKSSELQERVSRHQSLPDLSLTASGGFIGSAAGFGDSFQQIGDGKGSFWSAGMQFTVPLGNTAARNDYLRAKIRTEQLQTQIHAFEWKIRNDVEADMRALISARLQVQLADRSLQYAEQRLEEYRKNNRAGTTTVQDVLNSENDTISARNAQLDAVEAFAYAVAKVWRDTGVLLDRLDIRIDTEHPTKLTENAGQKPAPPPPPSPPVSSPQSPGTRLLPSSGGSPDTTVTTGQTKDHVAAVVANADTEERKPVRGDAGLTEDNSGIKEWGYILTVGNSVVESALTGIQRKLITSGLTPTVKPGPKRMEPMIRLSAGEFADQQTANRELARLRKAGADPFILSDGGGGYHLYAGTYYDRKQAELEKRRLAALGIRVSMKNVSLPMPTFVLTVGTFPTEKIAREWAQKLEKQGIETTLIQEDRLIAAR